ncbi:hypothetical protein DUI87_18499 [Hirundo rustica rustica]|uniref:Uncharacterized protein n=1 Tax=Hirundo rustica rustica TaxID=333673 RepID=A0A3M0K229_HIRRU|nr:hypothetical protein DUI87_18497 [Hirundo rustica rustica]RMC05311.1 hypothetical protein DUI87_18498 [Hirundo rustica rustica]RMC05312.1 hypothetical protein DUI87_18499 [Hirundo rustica rustica]
MLSQRTEEEVTQLFRGHARSHKDVAQVEGSSSHELSHRDGSKEQELSLGEARRYKDLSDWEESWEQGLSHRDVVSSPTLSDCEQHSEQELWHQEVSDWEESIGQELSNEEDSIGQAVPRGNGKPPAVQSRWEDDSDKELQQDDWESVTAHIIRVKPLLREDDECDEVSVLELLGEEAGQRTPGGFAGDGLAPPIPREAWVERQAFQPCPQGQLCAWPPHVEAQALDQQLGPHQKRPSRFRRALRALRSLFRCPCLAPQPED